MPRIIMTVNYEVDPAQREAYLALTRRIKDHYTADLKSNYSVFEQKGKPNQFTELFICQSQEEYDALEENQTEKTEALLEELQSYVKDGTMKYSTLIEAL